MTATKALNTLGSERKEPSTHHLVLAGIHALHHVDVLDRVGEDDYFFPTAVVHDDVFELVHRTRIGQDR